MTQPDQDRPYDQTGPAPTTPGAPVPPPRPEQSQGNYPRGGGYPQPGQPQGYDPRPADGEERTMMLLAHLSAPVSLVLSGGWLPFLGPLLIWLFYKDKSRAVRSVAAGAFNYNVTTTLVSWALWISVFLTLFIGLIWAIPIWIAMIIPHIIGIVRASDGRTYEYPFQIRILS